MYVLTTCADTIMGVTFCAVARPSTRYPCSAAQRHWLPSSKNAKACGTTSLTGTGKKEGIHGGCNHLITADVPPATACLGAGDGVMGVPAHDERDFGFAATQLPIQQVIAAEGQTFPPRRGKEQYAGQAKHRVHQPGELDGMPHQCRKPCSRTACRQRAGREKPPGACAIGA